MPLDERQQLRQLCLVVLEEMGGSLPGHALEPFRSAGSLRGVREAGCDMVEWTQDLAPDLRLARVEGGCAGPAEPSKSDTVGEWCKTSTIFRRPTSASGADDRS